MAIEVKQQKTGNLGSFLIIILILIMIGWLAWEFLKPSDFLKQPDIKDLLPSSSQELVEAKLDIGQVFNHPVFKTLTSHIIWPLEIPELGRFNPFKPF
ncbi:MAG: hypothetical protein PHF45_01740 [Candidatus Pacebacteria bacterium]|nr:hypothetical protein [Candidatus Paceibacterota bacterium]